MSGLSRGPRSSTVLPSQRPNKYRPSLVRIRKLLLPTRSIHPWHTVSLRSENISHVTRLHKPDLSPDLQGVLGVPYCEESLPRELHFNSFTSPTLTKTNFVKKESYLLHKSRISSCSQIPMLESKAKTLLQLKLNVFATGCGISFRNYQPTPSKTIQRTSSDSP